MYKTHEEMCSYVFLLFNICILLARFIQHAAKSTALTCTHLFLLFFLVSRDFSLTSDLVIPRKWTRFYVLVSLTRGDLVTEF